MHAGEVPAESLVAPRGRRFTRLALDIAMLGTLLLGTIVLLVLLTPYEVGDTRCLALNNRSGSLCKATAQGRLWGSAATIVVTGLGVTVLAVARHRTRRP